MSFKNQQNWNGFREADLNPIAISLTLSSGIIDTYITDAGENLFNTQVFSSIAKAFYTIQEEIVPVDDTATPNGSNLALIMANGGFSEADILNDGGATNPCSDGPANQELEAAKVRAKETYDQCVQDAIDEFVSSTGGNPEVDPSDLICGPCHDYEYGEEPSPACRALIKKIGNDGLNALCNEEPLEPQQPPFDPRQQPDCVLDYDEYMNPYRCAAAAECCDVASLKSCCRNILNSAGRKCQALPGYRPYVRDIDQSDDFRARCAGIWYQAVDDYWKCLQPKIEAVCRTCVTGGSDLYQQCLSVINSRNHDTWLSCRSAVHLRMVQQVRECERFYGFRNCPKKTLDDIDRQWREQMTECSRKHPWEQFDRETGRTIATSPDEY